MCINKPQHGISLIELILFIVIVSIALMGLLLVLNVNTKGSTDPLIRKQALAIAESILEEIELQDFSNSSCSTACSGLIASRAKFDDMFDYNGINTTGAVLTGIAGLASYSVQIAVTNPSTAWLTIPAGDIAQITVTVTDPSGLTLEKAIGYRLNY